ncbi:MAG: DUF1576 domain-containing protein [Bacilli bacterium]
MEIQTTKQRLKQYLFIIIICLVMMIFGFAYSGFQETFAGFIRLTTGTDHLFTDYFVQGSIGSAFFNAALLGFIAIALLVINKKDIDGMTIAGVFFFIGFAMFGKTIINTPPIILGVYIFSKVDKSKPFKDLLPAAFMGCTMAPAVSEVYFYNGLDPLAGIILGVILGLFLGFVINPVAKVAFNFHKGYNLYNVGFAGGLILTVVVSVLKVFGFEVKRQMMWYSEVNETLIWFTLFFFCYLCFYGLFYCLVHDDKNMIDRFERIQVSDGVAPTDYVKSEGIGPVLLNMGFIGMISVCFTIFVQAPLNGPTIGTIISICGFGAAGKNIRGICYIYLGALIGSWCGLWDLTQPSIIIGALFATGLCPLAATYGPIVAIIATGLHLSVVQNTSDLHFGLNLYNNGFSCGLVALFIRGLLTSVHTKKGDFLIKHSKQYQLKLKEEQEQKEE